MYVKTTRLTHWRHLPHALEVVIIFAAVWGDFEVSDAIVKSITSADGQRRIDFFRRDDGFFGCEVMKHYQSDQDDPWSPLPYWAPLPSLCSIFETLEIAEREARGRIAWLKKEACKL
jgi:hypothetical protein